MSLWAQYRYEREGVETLENEHGFICFKCAGPDCIIYDIYVVPEKRRSRIAFEMGDQVSALAKERGCDMLTGFVYPGVTGANESLKTQLAYGFQVHSTSENYIILKKELGGD